MRLQGSVQVVTTTTDMVPFRNMWLVTTSAFFNENDNSLNISMFIH